jgi:SAM-dependent methyltransferase
MVPERESAGAATRCAGSRRTNDTAPIDPARFYTGIVAELHAPLRSSAPDPDLYGGFIRAVGEPALELGCGDGDPMIELRCRGLDVEGVDSSPEMLERCRLAADRRGVDVVVHLQRMQDLDVARTFRCIYLAGASFNLLTTDEDALATLRRIRAHLHPDGSALVPLFIPTPTERLGHPVEAVEPDGALIRVTPISEWRDEERRIQQTVLRYERVSSTGRVAEDRPWTLHWHAQDGFRALATAADLRVAAVLDERGEPASPDDSTFAFWLQPTS